MYYLIKNINSLGQGIGIDISYPKLGVCRYLGNRYVRYICYDSKLLEIDHIDTSLSAKSYHDIKNIQIIRRKKNTNNDTSNFISVLDVTKAKLNFFDSNHFITIPKREMKNRDSVNPDPQTPGGNGQILRDCDLTPMRFTEIYDIIKFYQIVNSYPYNDHEIDSDEDQIVRVIRERFDDELLEFITTYEELIVD